MKKDHIYNTHITWTGVNKTGAAVNYKNYSRQYKIEIAGKPILNGSADSAFLGDASLHNPEDLLLASVSSCHMLWYLHLCTENNITVTSYIDKATAVMQIDNSGSGAFKSLCLNPLVGISGDNDADKAKSLHNAANKMCFIANSLNFKIDHQAKIIKG